MQWHTAVWFQWTIKAVNTATAQLCPCPTLPRSSRICSPTNTCCESTDPWPRLRLSAHHYWPCAASPLAQSVLEWVVLPAARLCPVPTPLRSCFSVISKLISKLVKWNVLGAFLKYWRDSNSVSRQAPGRNNGLKSGSWTYFTHTTDVIGIIQAPTLHSALRHRWML